MRTFPSLCLPGLRLPDTLRAAAGKCREGVSLPPLKRLRRERRPSKGCGLYPCADAFAEESVCVMQRRT
jgi:hypothetical protein